MLIIFYKTRIRVSLKTGLTL